MANFTVLAGQPARSSARARLGRLATKTGEILTPAPLFSTVRGAIPHIVGSSVPAALIFSQHFYDALGFAPLSMDQMNLRSQVSVIAASLPGTVHHKANTNQQTYLDTTQGTRPVDIRALAEFQANFGADVVVAPCDVPTAQGAASVGRNRRQKMYERSVAWLAEYAAVVKDGFLVATVPKELDGDAAFEEQVNALAKGRYSSTLGSFGNGLRIVGDHCNPISVLDAVLAGADLVCVDPTEQSDNGVALNYDLECSTPSLGLDLKDPKYALDATPLGTTESTFAYVHHLLDAREMTAQVLLQNHNLAVVERFFEDVRKALQDDVLEAAAVRFRAHYTD